MALLLLCQKLTRSRFPGPGFKDHVQPHPSPELLYNSFFNRIRMHSKDLNVQSFFALLRAELLIS